MTKKRLTEDQIQRWVMMRIDFCANSGVGGEPHSILAQEIMDELDSTEEQPDEEVGRTSVEERAKLFFDEVTDRFTPVWGKNAVRNMRERYRYIARRSLQLEAEAVAELAKELTEERDELKAKVTDLENKVKDAKNELAGWKLEYSDFTALRERRMTFEEKERLVEKASMELTEERDELRAKVEKLTKERDEALQRIKDWHRHHDAACRQRDLFKAEIEELKAKFDDIKKLVLDE